MFQVFDSRGKQPLGPEEVSMVQALIRDFCRERAFEPTCPEAQDAARRVLGWFHDGVTERGKLHELLRSFN